MLSPVGYRLPPGENSTTRVLTPWRLLNRGLEGVATLSLFQFLAS